MEPLNLVICRGMTVCTWECFSPLMFSLRALHLSIAFFLKKKKVKVQMLQGAGNVVGLVVVISLGLVHDMAISHPS